MTQWLDQGFRAILNRTQHRSLGPLKLCRRSLYRALSNGPGLSPVDSPGLSFAEGPGLSPSKAKWLELIPLVLSLVLALWAQWALDQRRYEPWSFVAYGLAAMLFVWAFRAWSLERPDGDDYGDIAPLSRKWWLVGLAAILGGFSFPLFRGNRFTSGGVLLWAGGLILLWWAMRDKGRWDESLLARWRKRLTPGGIRIPWATLAVSGSMLVGAFYRFYRLDEIPREMGCDLPLIYQNVKLILEGEFPVFFPIHPGREGLFFYLAAPYARLFGLDHYGIKFASACIGVLTIPVLYLLTRELFGREAGVYSAFFLSVARWHVILSRTGFRAILMPVFVMLVWYGLVRAMRIGRRSYFFWTGCALGLGMYTYNAFIIMPIGVVACLGVYTVMDRARFLRRHWKDSLLLFLVALFVFIPLGRYAWDEPRMYLYRVATRVTSIESQLPADILTVLLDNFRKAALMFNYVGDIVFISNVPFERQLGFASGILFVLGLAYALARWRRTNNVLVLGFLLFTVMPAVLSIAFPQEVPNATRACGALAPVYVLVGGALALLRRGFQDLLPEATQRRVVLDFRVSNGVDWHVARKVRLDARPLAVVGLVVLLALEARSVYPTYFERYVDRLPARNYSISLEIARAIDDFDDDGESYAVPWPYWYDGNALRAQLRVEDRDWHNEFADLHPNEAPLSTLEGKVMFILHPDDSRSMEVLRVFFPRGVALQHSDYDGNPAFIAFYGER